MSNDKSTHRVFYRRFEFWLILLTTIISIGALWISIISDNKNFYDYDALARLNIARKVTDSLTPGVAQLGGIWLPFPQVLFMPFTWNDFLWHSGLAGAISSMISFILGAYFLYQTVYIVTGRKLGGMIAWFIYVTNVNILILQAMAMSEAFFFCTVIMITYFLTKWAKTKNVMDLLFAAIFVSLSTLTRYEGYALFGAATLSVASVTLFTYGKSNLKRLEGILVLFMTLAGFGIFLWSLYSFLIFKDPIYWLNLYSGNKSVTSLDPTQLTQAADLVKRSTSAKTTIADATNVYGSAMLYMNGVILSFVGLLAFITQVTKGVVDLVKKRSNVLIFPTLIVAVCVFAFLIIGYSKHLIPTIETPYLTLETLFDKQRNFGSSSNIRYGLIITPIIALLVGIAVAKSKFFAFLVSAIIIFQIYAQVATPLFLTFSLAASAKYFVHKSALWFRTHHDGGLVLTSANRHENFIFQTGLPYKYFIHEGSQHYWKESIKNPTKHAAWIVMDTKLKGDAVNELIPDKTDMFDKYSIVFQEDNLLILKRKSN